VGHVVLAPLGGKRLMDFGEVIGYGSAGPSFRLGPVRAGGKAREAHIAFAAANGVAVQAFDDAAVAHGAEVLHAPKGRPEYTGYGALVRDPDGNGVEALCHR
jgi:catechol 2,3-dioxygenase-like lactoylglutathione lyase family enzyme